MLHLKAILRLFFVVLVLAFVCELCMYNFQNLTTNIVLAIYSCFRQRRYESKFNCCAMPKTHLPLKLI